MVQAVEAKLATEVNAIKEQYLNARSSLQVSSKELLQHAAHLKVYHLAMHALLIA